ncbi:hypothetical protein GGG87_07710 [Streptococcus sp. zg-86]|uniref:Uncharacterized protein n=1 Tax=Streptococcus zhangguiae TaxID=2664091 RepID=A0A6I4RAL4_9STRE|nr:MULTISPECIES: hypothetical protein [unclassified Streptococcus]MTB64879.1 hypothetical protein [Streptococcus sp. zg-86]MTB91051.1 hypothetical protein [Streptococcus sp. zg-36]MWV56866.1 hypothetical protein [Streptococcus sp. zg-70]QTH48331.1 hypothetical protein J5M87_03115 [Streptococcus sp. zg-86]
MAKNPLEDSIQSRMSAERYQVSTKGKKREKIPVFQILLILSMILGLIMTLVGVLTQLLK